MAEFKQLELPAEIWRQFVFEHDWRDRDPKPITHTVELFEYYANGSGKNAPHYGGKAKHTVKRYKRGHYHDWMKSQTTPWKRPPDQPMAKRGPCDPGATVTFKNVKQEWVPGPQDRPWDGYYKTIGQETFTGVVWCDAYMPKSMWVVTDDGSAYCVYKDTLTVFKK